MPRLDENVLPSRLVSERWNVPAAWLAGLAAYCLVIYGGFATGRTAMWITDLAWTVSALLAAVGSYRAASSLCGRRRIPWRLLAAACTSWLIGQLIWDWNELIRGIPVPFPSLSDYFYMGFGVLVVAAMVAFRQPDAVRVPTLRHLGNLALIVCCFAATYVTAILEPMLRIERSTYFLSIALTESLVMAVAFVVSVHFLWSYRWGALSTPLILIVAGVAIQAAADLIYIHALIVGDFGANHALNAAWMAAFGFQHWAAHEQIRLARSDASSSSVDAIEEKERWIEALLPGFLLLLIVIAAYSFRDQLSVRVLLLDAVILGLFAVILAAREVWLYLEERRLQQELETRRIELDRAREDLQATLTELRDTEQRLRLAANAGNVGLWVWDLRDNTVYYSPEWKRQLGYREHEITDAFEEWRSRVHPDDLDRAMATVESLVEHPWEDYQLELRLRHRDSSYRWVLSHAALLREEDGKAVSMVGSQVDITKRKQMEEALRDSEARYRELAGQLEHRVTRRTAQLQDAYRELESFAYAVSHDLKAPLRAMDGFSHLLMQTSYDKLNDAEREHIRRIRRGALQMDALIDGLLAYSRMERREMRTDAVDVRAAVEAIIAEREEEIRERGIEVRLQVPPLSLRVDREGFSVILRNLIENAVKFTRDVTSPVIEIGAQSTAGKVILRVKDNGIGFEQRYHDQIFLIFQRLHRGDKYRGTGIGLALARKAAQRMDGRLWAESAPGQGATFFLELPA
ncbi:MAG: sensor histidine kinase [Steroidobacter sp.]